MLIFGSQSGSVILKQKISSISMTQRLWGNEDHNVLWEFIIHTFHVIEAWRPDLVVADRENQIWKSIDYIVPGDSRFEGKEKESIGK